MVKPIIDQLVFFHYYRKYLKKLIHDQLYEYMESFLSEFCVVSEKHIPHKISSGYFRNSKHSMTRWVMLVQLSWICLKHMTI